MSDIYPTDSEAPTTKANSNEEVNTFTIGSRQIDFDTHPHVAEAESRHMIERNQHTHGASNSSERRAQAKALPSKDANEKAAMALDIPSIPATKRRASDAAWNRDRLFEARERVEELKASMNARLHDTSNIAFEADVAALQSAAERMQSEASKHR